MRALPVLRLMGASLWCLQACSDNGLDSSYEGSSSGKGSSSSSSSGGSSGLLGDDPGGNGTGTTNGACSDDAKLVYVLSGAGDLYAFDPSSLKFTKRGQLDCKASPIAMPNSMAVARDGTAWVNYSDGTLFRVQTSNAKCESTSFAPGQSGFGKFGMAFSTNGQGGEAETLFVVGIEDGSLTGQGGKGLARVDLSTMKLTPVGDFTGALKGFGAELTGTGDGRLYGFFTTQPAATLSGIDKASGSTSETQSLAGVNTGRAWAFSFWGGDFWFYTSDGLSPSRVTQLRSADKSLKVVMPDVGGFQIVGAGVSTCAPLTSPK